MVIHKELWWGSNFDGIVGCLVGCCQVAVVSTHQKFEEGKCVNQRQGHGLPRLIDAHGERRLFCLVCCSSNSWKGFMAMIKWQYISAWFIWGCIAADWLQFSCWPLSTPKCICSGHWTSQLDHGAVREGDLVWWMTFSFTSCLGMCASRPCGWVGTRRFYCKKASWRGNVVFWAVFCCKNLEFWYSHVLLWHILKLF